MKEYSAKQVPALQCTNCGKYKVQIGDMYYVSNGREVGDDVKGLWVEETPSGPYFSTQKLPNTKRWKIIHEEQLIQPHQQKHMRKWGE